MDHMPPAFTQDPRDPAFVADPYAAYRRMRALGPLFAWTDYGFVCSAQHETVSTVLRDRRFGREVAHVADPVALGLPQPPAHLRPFYDFEARSMLEREPPVHTRLRGLVNKAFVSRAIDRVRPAIAALANDLIDAFEPQRHVELIEAYATPIPVYTIADLLGINRAAAPYLLDWSHRMVAMYQFGRTETIEREAVAATLDFSAFMHDEIAARRRRPGEDLLSALVAARDDQDRLDENELVTTAILLLNAGHEATVHAIANAVHGLLSACADTRAAFANADATAATVEEGLRHDPPLHLFTRYVLEPLELHGIRFHVGDRIGLLLAAAGRDPARFPDPDRFDPTRPPGPHLAFGAGIHFCVGAPLARAELAIALPILFGRLPGLVPDGSPTWRDSYHFRGLTRLRLRW